MKRADQIHELIEIYYRLPAFQRQLILWYARWKVFCILHSAVYEGLGHRLRWTITHFRPRVESFFVSWGQYGRYGIFVTLSWFDRDQEYQHWVT